MTVHEVGVVVLGMGPAREDAAERLAVAGLSVPCVEPGWSAASAPTENAYLTFHRAMEPALQELAPAELPPLKLR
jgi:hypothetical protein